jgi:hypothetical protein
VYRYGVFDVKAENLMRIDNQLKIIDVNMTPFPLPTVWKMVDEVKPKLPKQLMFLFKKLRRCLMIDNLRRKGLLDFGMFLGCLNFTETMNPAPTAPNDVFAPGFRCNGILHISKPSRRDISRKPKYLETPH